MIELKGIGVDILNISRIKKVYLEYGERFLNRIYTQDEMRYIMSAKINPYERMAALFCSKEAVFKTFQTKKRIVFREIEIIHLPYPVVRLYGGMLHAATERGIKDILVSISHDGDFCVAFAVAI